MRYWRESLGLSWFEVDITKGEYLGDDSKVSATGFCGNLLARFDGEAAVALLFPMELCEENDGMNGGSNGGISSTHESESETSADKQP